MICCCDGIRVKKVYELMVDDQKFVGISREANADILVLWALDLQPQSVQPRTWRNADLKVNYAC